MEYNTKRRTKLQQLAHACTRYSFDDFQLLQSVNVLRNKQCAHMHRCSTFISASCLVTSVIRSMLCYVTLSDLNTLLDHDILLLLLLLFVAAGTAHRTTLLHITQLPLHVLHGVFSLQSVQKAQPHL
jgi:hypothetical protein